MQRCGRLLKAPPSGTETNDFDRITARTIVSLELREREASDNVDGTARQRQA